MRRLLFLCAALLAPVVSAATSVHEYTVPQGSQPHDVAPAVDGGAWYTAQATGRLGHLDPKSGRTERLSERSRTGHSRRPTL